MPKTSRTATPQGTPANPGSGDAPRRAYPGYEDYSPEGRAAIGAFNKAGGPNNLGYDDPVGPYDDAAGQAQNSAIAQMILKHLNLHRGDDFGRNIPAPHYDYPPKD